MFSFFGFLKGCWRGFSFFLFRFLFFWAHSTCLVGMGFRVWGTLFEELGFMYAHRFCQFYVRMHRKRHPSFFAVALLPFDRRFMLEAFFLAVCYQAFAGNVGKKAIELWLGW